MKANEGWREQARRECGVVLQAGRAPFSLRRSRRPWETVKAVGVRVFPQLVEEVRKEDGEVRCREAVERTLQVRGDFDLWAFTDGSAREGVKDGGAACVGWFAGEEFVVREPAGCWCSSFVAEVRGMLLAVRCIRERCPRSAIVLSDSQALLRVVEGGAVPPNALVQRLLDELVAVRCELRVDLVIQWIPGHVGVEGNEWADREAGVASCEAQDGVSVEFECARMALRRATRYAPALDERLSTVYGGDLVRGECGRRESVLLAQLRAGHCPRTRYWRQRVGLEAVSACEACGEEESKDHWLLCDRWEGVRRELGIFDLAAIRDEGRILRFLRRCHGEWWSGGGGGE